MSTPPIQTSGPHVSDEVPWETRRHLQIIYSKLGNHVQGISLLTAKVNALKPGSTTITQSGGGASVPISLGGVNDQSGNTTYQTTPGDNGVLLVLNDASAVAVTLDSAANPDFYFTATNFGAGLVTFTPNGGAQINGAANFTLTTDGFTVILWTGTTWYATAVQSAPTGISVTITTAKLTSLGSNGSMTFTAGVLTAQTPAT